MNKFIKKQPIKLDELHFFKKELEETVDWIKNKNRKYNLMLVSGATGIGKTLFVKHVVQNFNHIFIDNVIDLNNIQKDVIVIDDFENIYNKQTCNMFLNYKRKIPLICITTDRTKFKTLITKCFDQPLSRPRYDTIAKKFNIPEQVVKDSSNDIRFLVLNKHKFNNKLINNISNYLKDDFDDTFSAVTNILKKISLDQSMKSFFVDPVMVPIFMYVYCDTFVNEKIIKNNKIINDKSYDSLLFYDRLPIDNCYNIKAAMMHRIAINRNKSEIGKITFPRIPKYTNCKNYDMISLIDMYIKKEPVKAAECVNYYKIPVNALKNKTAKFTKMLNINMIEDEEIE